MYKCFYVFLMGNVSLGPNITLVFCGYVLYAGEWKVCLR